MRRNSRYAYATPLDTLNNRLNHRDPRIRDVQHYTTFVLSTKYYAKVTSLQKIKYKTHFYIAQQNFSTCHAQRALGNVTARARLLAG